MMCGNLMYYVLYDNMYIMYLLNVVLALVLFTFLQQHQRIRVVGAWL